MMPIYAFLHEDRYYVFSYTEQGIYMKYTNYATHLIFIKERFYILWFKIFRKIKSWMTSVLQYHVSMLNDVDRLST